MKVLWLIDNPTYALSHKKNLEIVAKAEVHLAGNCKYAQDLIDSNDYDLVLLLVGTSAGSEDPRYTKNTPAVRIFYEINKSSIRRHLFLTFAPDDSRLEDEVCLMEYADVRDFATLITTKCQESK